MSKITYDQLAEDIALQSGGIPDVAIRQFLPMCVQRYVTESMSLMEVANGHIKNGMFIPSGECAGDMLPIDNRYEAISVERVTYKRDVVPLVSIKGSADVIGPSATLHYRDGNLAVKFTGIYDTDEDIVTVYYYVAPRRTATSCTVPRDSGLFMRAVTALTLFYLYNTPNREWTNVELASYNLSEYQTLLIEGKRKAKNNDTPNLKECAFSW